jgi:hypothetical protein
MAVIPTLNPNLRIELRAVVARDLRGEHRDLEHALATEWGAEIQAPVREQRAGGPFVVHQPYVAVIRIPAFEAVYFACTSRR